MSSVIPTDIVYTSASEHAADELVVSGRRYALSPQAAETFREALVLLEGGYAVDVRPVEDYLTTQQVAEILGVSRPTVVRLLERGALPYDQPAGVHRRISRSALETYQEQLIAERQAAFQELTDTYTPQDAELDGFVSTR